jgi:uncharacterized protein
VPRRRPDRYRADEAGPRRLVIARVISGTSHSLIPAAPGRCRFRALRRDAQWSVPVPQRLTVVTLGARNMPGLRAFYRALGWHENQGSDDTFTSFTLGGVRLALYPIALLAAEAAPDEAPVEPGSWNGVTLAVNVASRDEVDDVFAAAIRAGARAVAAATEREWGGYTGYIADPEDNRWEIAWAPGFTDFV